MSVKVNGAVLVCSAVQFTKSVDACTAQDWPSAPVTVSSYLFGRRSILRLMVWGNGEYRRDHLHADMTEQQIDDVISPDCKREVDEQLLALTGRR